jgi:oligoribonuclease
MKYVSIDIETLGTDPDTCDMIEFGAVIDDLKTELDGLPRYHCYIPKDIYRGQPFAMAMHAKILKRIADREIGYSYVPGDMLGDCFKTWLAEHGFWDSIKGSTIEVVVAGKNFQGFDLRFLRRLPKFLNHISIFHRPIDPCMRYFDILKDKVPPSLDECLKRAGIEKKVNHTAVEDALDVIQCIRRSYGIKY